MGQMDLLEPQNPGRASAALTSIPYFEPRGDWGDSIRLISELNFLTLPQHIAVIMDGNRRWARERGLNMLEGHRAGVKKAREVADLTLDINTVAGTDAIEVLSFFSFSKENWTRSFLEVSSLMGIFEKAAIEEILPLHERNIRVRVIGDMDDLPISLRERIHDIEELTRNNTGLRVNFCLSYSGRSDILKGVKRLFRLYKEGKIDFDSINEAAFSRHLDTGGQPDPDLLIRTSGEMRFSNFLLWQIAYTELWVTNAYWPDFNYMHYIQALKDFQKRERRFGGG
jgi:undecaprenyl diphosphate synthase